MNINKTFILYPSPFLYYAAAGTGEWSEWTTWTCLAECGETTEFRNRTCEASADNPPYGDCEPSCPGSDSEQNQCDNGCCERE
jgi:hypothetical protein